MNDDTQPLDEHIEHLLASEAVWADPSDGLERAVIDQMGEPRTGRRLWLAAAAAVALVVALVALTRPADPDWSVALAAPEGSGIVGEVAGFNEPTGTRVVLTVENLEPAAAGTFYEVWWVDLDNGGAVSSGSFLESDTIDMWMGVRRPDFPKMLITREILDGDPARGEDVIAWSDD